MVHNMSVGAAAFQIGFGNQSGGAGSGVGGNTFSLTLELATDMARLQQLGQSASPCPPGDTGSIAKSYVQGLYQANRNDPEALGAIGDYFQTFQFQPANSVQRQIAQEWAKVAGPSRANASTGLPAGYFA